MEGIRPTVRGSVMNPNDHHTVVVKVVHLSVDHLQCHHGVNQRLVRKLVVVKSSDKLIVRGRKKK